MLLLFTREAMYAELFKKDLSCSKCDGLEDLPNGEAGEYASIEYFDGNVK